MVKIHNITGLKYLCMTEKKNYLTYSGSGTVWKRHLKKHGKDFYTILLHETEDKKDFKEVALFFSNYYDVIFSSEWANLKNEEGDGGDTVSRKIWITDGIDEKYIDKDEFIPLNWKRGRNNSCKFLNKEFQQTLSNRVDRKKNGESIKRVWESGKFKRNHKKCGTRGSDNPAKRPEVREKISKSMSKCITLNEISFSSIASACEFFGVNRYIIDKWRKNGERCGIFGENR